MKVVTAVGIGLLVVGVVGSGSLSPGACRDESRCAIPKARADIDTFKTCLKMYRADHRRYPTTAEGLATLTRPTDDWPEFGA